MEVVMQMMYSYSLELLCSSSWADAFALNSVTLRKINKWKKKEKEQFSELEEKLSRISEKQNETARRSRSRRRMIKWRKSPVKIRKKRLRRS